MYAQPTPLTKMTTTMERSRRRCGLVCERVTARAYKRQRRQVGDTTHLFYTRPYSVCVCVRMLRARGHTLIIITLGTRETKLVYPRAPRVAGLRRCRPRNNRYYTRLYDARHTSGYEKIKSITQKISTVSL